MICNSIKFLGLGTRLAGFRMKLRPTSANASTVSILLQGYIESELLSHLGTA